MIGLFFGSCVKAQLVILSFFVFVFISFLCRYLGFIFFLCRYLVFIFFLCRYLVFISFLCRYLIFYFLSVSLSGFYFLSLSLSRFYFRSVSLSLYLCLSSARLYVFNSILCVFLTAGIKEESNGKSTN